MGRSDLARETSDRHPLTETVARVMRIPKSIYTPNHSFFGHPHSPKEAHEAFQPGPSHLHHWILQGRVSHSYCKF